jgi:hypothetical protein
MPSHFTAGERAPSTPHIPHIRGWAGPRASLDDVEKRKLLTLPGLELQPFVIQPIASCYIDSTILAPSYKQLFSEIISLLAIV